MAVMPAAVAPSARRMPISTRRRATAIGRHAVESETGEDQRQRTKERGQHRDQTLLRARGTDLVVHQPEREGHGPHRRHERRREAANQQRRRSRSGTGRDDDRRAQRPRARELPHREIDRRQTRFAQAAVLRRLDDADIWTGRFAVAPWPVTSDRPGWRAGRSARRTAPTAPRRSSATGRREPGRRRGWSRSINGHSILPPVARIAPRLVPSNY